MFNPLYDSPLGVLRSILQILVHFWCDHMVKGRSRWVCHTQMWFHHIRLYAEIIDKLHALCFNGLLYTVMFLKAPGISAVQKQRKNIKDKRKIQQVWVTHFMHLNEHCFYCKESLWIKIWFFFFFLFIFSALILLLHCISKEYSHCDPLISECHCSLTQHTDKGNTSVHHIFFLLYLP